MFLAFTSTNASSLPTTNITTEDNSMYYNPYSINNEDFIDKTFRMQYFRKSALKKDLCAQPFAKKLHFQIFTIQPYSSDSNFQKTNFEDKESNNSHNNNNNSVVVLDSITCGCFSPHGKFLVII